jgi:hypothetical protein
MPRAQRKPAASTVVTKRAPLARYANYFEVGHNAFEFLIDFGQFQPEVAAVKLHTRMATGPTHAKLLSAVLAHAVSQFEAEHGEIPDLSDSDNPLELLLASVPDFERRAAKLLNDALPPDSIER